MSKVNRGKQFETHIIGSFEKLGGCCVDRIKDQMSGYFGSSNICDFVLYKFPLIHYFECKAVYGNTLSIHSNNPKRAYGDISNTQWKGLLENSKIPGVIAGYIIWYIDHDVTVFVRAQDIEKHRMLGHKSLNIKDLNRVDSVEIYGNKRRVLFNYDLNWFLQQLFCMEVTNGKIKLV